MHKPEREQLVRQFNRTFEAYLPDPKDNVDLGVKLLYEEFNEVREALVNYQIPLNLHDEQPSEETQEHLLKELCDLQYVLSGLVDRLGWGSIFDVAFWRVHESNMSKVDDNGEPERDPMTGKILKGKNYQPPKLTSLIRKVNNDDVNP